MKRRATRTTIATLNVLAYLWVGLGTGPQAVYCIGSDGHSGIELAHGSSPCNAPADRSSASALGSKSCIDTPLLIQASNEQEKLGKLAAPSYVVTAALVSPPSFSQSRLARGYSVALARELAASLRTTVLRV